MTPYWNSSYKITATEGVDELTVEKFAGGDWSTVSMVINGGVFESKINLRSRHMAEQLHFMLGQMLGK